MGRSLHDPPRGRQASGARRSRRAWLAGSALLATSVVGLTEPVVGGGGGDGGGSGSPDAYVTDWDVVGTQAFTASGLTGAEGYPIFAYVAIAAYDSVMAIEGGYEPFAVDIDAPEGASAEAAVAAAARAILVHYLPAQSEIVEAAYTASLGTIEDGQAEDDGVATGEQVAAAAHRPARRRRLPRRR